MNPDLRVVALALILPALATPASAAVLYLPPECQDVPPDVPEGCPGVRVGDPFTAPEGECIDLRTNLVYACEDISPGRKPLGIGIPTAYAYADARSAMTDPDCAAQRLVEGPLQWCVRFGVAVAAMPDLHLSSPRFRVEAMIDDSCDPADTTVFRFRRDYSGPAVWEHAQNGLSKCGAHVGWITATVTVSDLYTGYVYHSSQSKAFYGPEGVVWVGAGDGPCVIPVFWPWESSHADCMLYYNKP